MRLTGSVHQYQIDLLWRAPLFFSRAYPGPALKGLAVSFLVTMILVELFYPIQQQVSRKAIPLCGLGCLFFQLWLNNSFYMGACYVDTLVNYGPGNARLWFGGLFKITSVFEALTPFIETFHSPNRPFLLYSLLIPFLIVLAVTPWPKRQKRKTKSRESASPHAPQTVSRKEPQQQQPEPAAANAVPAPAATYRIVFDGKIQEGLQIEEVKASLGKLFRTEDTRRIDRLFRNTPNILKKHLSWQQALKYQQIFEKTGACCQIHEEQPESKASTPQAARNGADNGTQTASTQLKANAPQATTKSLGAEAKLDRETGSGGALALFFGAIPLVLGVVFLTWSVTTIWKSIETHTVYETGTCTIQSKQIIEDDGTYHPHFEFTVWVNDDECYSASGYSVDTSSTSGRSGKEAILARFEIGESYTCWYHPEQPTQAVLTRAFPWTALSPMAFGLPAFLIGVVVLVGLIRHMRSQPKKDKDRPKTLISPEAKAVQTSRPSSPERPKPLDKKDVVETQAAKTPRLSSPPSPPEASSPRPVASTPQQATRLTPDDPAKKIDALYIVGALLALAFVALCFMMLPVAFGLMKSLFTEGIARTGKMLLELIRSHWSMIPLFFGLYGFLKWFSKRHNRKSSLAKEVAVELQKPSLQTGETGAVRILPSHKGSFKLLQVSVLGKEIVEYTSGTDTLKKEHVFYTAPLAPAHAATTEENERGGTSFAVSIPSGAVPSFRAQHNQIRWSILLKTQDREFGEMTLEYPFQVASA